MSNRAVQMGSHKVEDGGFLYEPPAKCHYCERDMRPKEWPEGSIGPYIMIRMPIPGIALYQCTKCSAIMGNIHASTNLRRMKEIQETSRIVIPTGNLIGLQ